MRGSRNTSRGRARRVWNLLRAASSAFFIVALLCVIAGTVALGYAWRVKGYTPLAVISGSMEPTIPTGSLVFVHDRPTDTIDVGDVVTFDPPGKMHRVTHRVAEIRTEHGQRYFYTKGDANPARDDWSRGQKSKPGERLSPGIAFQGPTAPVVAWHVPYGGYAVEHLTSNAWLRPVVVVVPLALVLLQLLLWIWRPHRPRHHRRAPVHGPEIAGTS